MLPRILKFATFLIFAVTTTTQAATLPAVTGLTLEGNKLSWDAQDGATGYNIYISYTYYDTIREDNSYTLTAPGNYTVVSFNDNGEFGVFAPATEGNSTTFVTYDDSASQSVSYNQRGAYLHVAVTCTDVMPGESCVAHCPRPYYDEFRRINRYPISTTGGACSTSDIVEADAFIQPLSYKCTVPTFSGEVVAQAVCVYN